jgi:antibiotic biosynthesis monooxygenase (ABM) superfamily enzyme
MMFTEHVPSAKVADYEKWSAGIHGDTKRYEGFISVDVIRPGEGDGLEFTTLVKFDSCDNLKRWKDSTSLANWLVDLPELLVNQTHEQSSIGMQLWFDRPKNPRSAAEPPFWKRVIVGVICVYPLIRACKLNCVSAHASIPCTGGNHEQRNNERPRPRAV